MNETLSVLTWARKYAGKNEVVNMFWEQLCTAVREPVNASAKRVYRELGAYGGNTLLNRFRPNGGVEYGEVAYDVACTLKPFGQDRTFDKGDLIACERSVLKNMNIPDKDIRSLERSFLNTVDAARDQVVDDATRRTVHKYLESAAYGAAAAKLEREMAKRAAILVANQAAKQMAATMLRSISVILGLWVVVDITGPAKRVTIPAVTYVALLRRLHEVAA